MRMHAEMAGAAAFIVTVVLAPILIQMCRRWKILDWPGALKPHATPTPRLGGTAVISAVAFAVFISVGVAGNAEWWFVAALSLIWGVGLADDLRGVPIPVRIATQVLAGAMLWYAGWRFTIRAPAVVSALAVCVFVVISVNSMNFLDGSDGLAAGTAAIIAAAYLIVPGAATEAFARAIAWSIVGACVGFLIFNRPPVASLFLGDAGSLALGFSVGFIGLDLLSRAGSGAGALRLFPFLVAGLPFADAVLAVGRRLLQKRSAIEGDRRHIYDLMSLRGLSAGRIALTCYGITIALASLGWISGGKTPPVYWTLAALGLGSLLAAAIWLGALRKDAA